MMTAKTLLLLLLLFLSKNKAVHSLNSDSKDEPQEDPCTLYLARSTIPGAGWGVFAGVDFSSGETMLSGDLMVPLDNMPFHSGSETWDEGVDELFLWSDYTWEAKMATGVQFDYSGISESWTGEENEEGGGASILTTVEMASFGLGSMPNCKFGFVNVYSDPTLADTAGLDRNSPGNGAFTPYHERVGRAQGFVPAGAEIFEDYGFDYFHERPGLELVPHQEDYETADTILNALRMLRRNLGRSSNKLPMTAILRDVYDITKSAWNSRAMNALPEPPQGEDYTDDKNYKQFLAQILTQKSIDIEKNKTIRSIQWLKQEGICMDGLRGGTSTIPHAGRGAFATKAFQTGDRIAPVPLIHMPNKNVLTMYAPLDNKEPVMRNVSNPIGIQLFMNYVFGHRNSTLLLSPYGYLTSLVNHGSGSAANARMVWAHEWMRNPEWLELTPEGLMECIHAGLGWDLIALRDIEVEEEVLIDYGPEWEAAWEKHVSNWFANETIFTGTSFPYVPAEELNDNKEQALLEAMKNNVDYSYWGGGVRLYCYYYERAIPGDAMNEFSDGLQECRPVKAYQCPETGEQLFWAEIIEWLDDGEGWQITVLDMLFDASTSIFHFTDDPYNAAHRMPWAFRHAMAIPDDMLPKQWQNV